VAKSEINGKAWTSAAEVGIQAEADVTAVQPVSSVKTSQSLVVYDLQGRQVSHPSKGLYLSQGKKILK
jgi:beta-galactosidase